MTQHPFKSFMQPLFASEGRDGLRTVQIPLMVFYLGFGFEWCWRYSFSNEIAGSIMLHSPLFPSIVWSSSNPMSIGFAAGMITGFLLRKRLSPLGRRRDFTVCAFGAAIGTLLFHFGLGVSNMALVAAAFFAVDFFGAFLCLMWWETFTILSIRMVSLLLASCLAIQTIGSVIHQHLSSITMPPLVPFLCLFISLVALAVLRRERYGKDTVSKPQRFKLGIAPQSSVSLFAISFIYALMFSIASNSFASTEELGPTVEFGSIAAMVILVFSALSPNGQTPLANLRLTAFPIFIVGFLLLVASGNDTTRLMALGFIHCGFYYFTILLIVITIYVASRSTLTATTAGSFLHSIIYLGVIAGSVSGSFALHLANFDSMTLSVFASICFLALFLAVFVGLELKGDGTVWGMLDKKTPSELQLALAQKRCKALADEYHLTNREVEVSVELAQGNTPTEIAEQFVVSVQTVRTHINNIYKKTDVHSNTELLSLIREYPTEELDIDGG